jgi:hypothetical protein
MRTPSRPRRVLRVNPPARLGHAIVGLDAGCGSSRAGERADGSRPEIDPDDAPCEAMSQMLQALIRRRPAPIATPRSVAS